MSLSALSTRGTNFLVEFHRHVVDIKKRKLTDNRLFRERLITFRWGVNYAASF